MASGPTHTPRAAPSQPEAAPCRKRERPVLLALAAAAALAACGEPASSDLFPLEPGRSWTYRVTTDYEDSSREQGTLVLRSLPRDTLAAQDGLEPGSAWHRRSDSGIDYWLRQDASGIYRVASKSDVEAEPRPDKTRRYVLKTPYAAGTQWQADTAPYLFRRRAEFPPEVRHGHPGLPMLYRIAALDQSVAAGGTTYIGCLKVEGRGQIKLFVDGVSGQRDLPVLTREWYCPGAGLVRLERDELTGAPATSFVYGGRLVMELVELES